MALYKAIRQDDGVTTKYHRVLFVTHTVNRQNSIAVLSYTDDVAREMELENTEAQPYRKAVTYEIDYDENMTPAKAYAYLKTLPIFEGAEDV